MNHRRPLLRVLSLRGDWDTVTLFERRLGCTTSIDITYESGKLLLIDWVQLKGIVSVHKGVCFNIV